MKQFADVENLRMMFRYDSNVVILDEAAGLSRGAHKSIGPELLAELHIFAIALPGVDMSFGDDTTRHRQAAPLRLSKYDVLKDFNSHSIHCA